MGGKGTQAAVGVEPSMGDHADAHMEQGFLAYQEHLAGNGPGAQRKAARDESTSI